jgi:hypothetical protein
MLDALAVAILTWHASLRRKERRGAFLAPLWNSTEGLGHTMPSFVGSGPTVVALSVLDFNVVSTVPADTLETVDRAVLLGITQSWWSFFRFASAVHG